MSLLLEVLWDFPGGKGSERPREMAFELRADGLWGIVPSRERPGIGEICQLAATVAEVSIEIFFLLKQQWQGPPSPECS